MRSAGMSSKVIAATPRQLESLIRLAESHAKMRLSHEVRSLLAHPTRISFQPNYYPCCFFINNTNLVAFLGRRVRRGQGHLAYACLHAEVSD